jgi:hypothetical protein
VLAQALLERGLLEGALSGIGAIVTRASVVVQDRPWLWVAGALALLLLFRGGLRRDF